MIDPITLALLALTCGLGDDRFPVRQAASAHLERLGVLALPCLTAALHDDDPEIRGRADVLLDRLAARCPGWTAGQIAAEWGRPWPWCDCLPPDWEGRWLLQQEVLRAAGVPPEGGWSTTAATAEKSAGYPSYRRATGFMIPRLLRDGWRRRDVLRLLEAMAAEEVLMRERMAGQP